MQELARQPIPNVVNVDEIQKIIDTNKQLAKENERMYKLLNDTYNHLLAMRSLEEYRIRKMLEEIDNFKDKEDN